MVVAAADLQAADGSSPSLSMTKAREVLTSPGPSLCAYPSGLIVTDRTDIVNDMGRPTDGPEAKSEKYSARFTVTEVRASRAIRGNMSMGSWMRLLVLKAIAEQREEQK